MNYYQVNECWFSFTSLFLPSPCVENEDWSSQKHWTYREKAERLLIKMTGALYKLDSLGVPVQHTYLPALDGLLPLIILQKRLKKKKLPCLSCHILWSVFQSLAYVKLIHRQICNLVLHVRLKISYLDRISQMVKSW